MAYRTRIRPDPFTLRAADPASRRLVQAMARWRLEGAANLSGRSRRRDRGASLAPMARQHQRPSGGIVETRMARGAGMVAGRVERVCAPGHRPGRFAGDPDV